MIEELIKISKYAGMREDLVQAGGGNSSVKNDDGTMLIKASGCQLAEITYNFGYAKVDYKLVADFMDYNRHKVLCEDEGKQILIEALLEGNRPSIETFLHAVTDRVTLHTHPTLVNVLTARKGGMEILKQLFPNALMVEYATPGVKLAQEYYKAFKEGNNTYNIIFLKNHGLVVSGDTAKEVVENTEYVVNSIAKFLGVDNSAYTSTTLVYDFLSQYDFMDNKVLYLSLDKIIDNQLINSGYKGWSFIFCPDCIVYCNKKMLDLNLLTNSTLEEFQDKYGTPVVVVYGKNLYIIAESVKKAKEIEAVLRFSAVIVNSNTKHEINCLDKEEQDFLLNWESERYRKNIR